MQAELAAALRKASGVAPEPSVTDDLWPTIEPEAFHGLAGDVVKTISPHTEADPVAILIQLLACFGNMVGPKSALQSRGRLSSNEHQCSSGRRQFKGKKGNGRQPRSFGRQTCR